MQSKSVVSEIVESVKAAHLSTREANNAAIVKQVPRSLDLLQLPLRPQ